MYNFIDVNEVSEVAVLPSEALQINGEFIENIIPGYRTLQVSGREALSPELNTYETGVRDGSALQSKRYPARTIIVRYQLISKSNEAFRDAYNKLASVLDVEEAELIFNDEPDKFFKGTLSSIGEVTPGVNSVVGEFEFLCADPFKYSVVEYEAEPSFVDGSFLIDYNGTYKAYPTLEAEFFSENESVAALTGNGDCGYVAFFNENEKIIQIGNPDEADTETYVPSQTLVNQQFNKETAWNAAAQANWATNRGMIPSGSVSQVGNVAITTASYATTTAPTTSGTLLTVTSKAAKPYVNYRVTAQVSGRKADRATVNVTITTVLVDSSGSGATAIASGAKITLNKTKIYVSSDASSSAGTKTGTFYLWDSSVIKGRIRITNSSSNVGKSGQVVGWVNVSDINVAASTSLGAECGLKGSIQFNGGDWNNVTIKNEGSKWTGYDSHTANLTVEVKNLEADSTVIEDIKFKVVRTDDENNDAGVLEETNCKDLELSTYTAPVADSWYLMPETYGTGSQWHGPSITRTVPADAAGNDGATDFTFSWRQKMSIGSSSSATQEMGEFAAMLITGSGSNRRILAGVTIYKGTVGKTTKLSFYVNGKAVQTLDIDISLNNIYFGNNSTKKGITTVKTSTIIKTGSRFEFNIGGITGTCYDASAKNLPVTEITFYFLQYGTKPTLSYNGLYWAKFIKNNCDTYADIPNKFSSNDIVTADCKSGKIYLNNTPTPALGALGNDWEDFYLTPGLNQIGFAYSDWVSAAYAPKFKIRYREVFI